MGNLLSNVWARFAGLKDVRVVMVGLDAAGKTTILYRLSMGESITTVPTVGFNVDNVSFKNLNFTVWDIGGQDKIRSLWKYYYQGTDAVIFVVDSTDVGRLTPNDEYECSAFEELHRLLRDDNLRDAALLVLANKQDLPGAASVSKISKDLGLDTLRGREWFVQGACGPTGQGLYEGLDWLANTIKKRK